MILFILEEYFKRLNYPVVEQWDDLCDLGAYLNVGKLTDREVASYKTSSKGQKVESIQKALIKLGFDLGTYGADGIFSNTMERQVKCSSKAIRRPIRHIPAMILASLVKWLAWNQFQGQVMNGLINEYIYQKGIYKNGEKFSLFFVLVNIIHL
ncbi:peptidoglycan-binding domain-containing protein [Vibrio fluvialis]|uniref:peptidoglycan-binding domain-containing protein n=1 Tax=Vibrio fluvialis TaxID=676 RepID=UPI003D107F9F